MSKLITLAYPGSAQRQIEEAAFNATLARVHRDHGEHVTVEGLYPADRARQDAWGAIEREYQTRARTDAALRQRMDAWGSDGFHLARQLEYVHAQVLEEKHPMPNGLTLFPMSTSVPVGARTHTVQRVMDQGEAVIYRRGQDVPRVGASQAEEQFPVRHIVTSYGLDIFEQQSSDFANTSLMARLLRTARRVVERKLNRCIWYGHKSAGLYGVLDYPWLAKVASAVNYYDDGATAADDVIADLHKWANWAQENSEDTFAPNVMVTSPRVRNYLMNTPRSTTSDTSIGEYFLRTNAHINSIEEAWELQGVGPAGATQDGILFYRSDSESIAVEMVQPFTTLPAQRMVFDDLVYAYASYGGVVMRDVGNNLLAWVTAGA